MHGWLSMHMSDYVDNHLGASQADIIRHFASTWKIDGSLIFTQFTLSRKWKSRQVQSKIAAGWSSKIYSIIVRQLLYTKCSLIQYKYLNCVTHLAVSHMCHFCDITFLNEVKQVMALENCKSCFTHAAAHLVNFSHVVVKLSNVAPVLVLMVMSITCSSEKT